MERVLLFSRFSATAKAYILYRDQHARNREFAGEVDTELVDSYLARSDWRVQESSNEGYSLQGLHNYVSSEVSRAYWLSRVYTLEVRNAHEAGDLHIHDLGFLSVYCVGWDLQDLLCSGFQGCVGKVQSAPPRHFRAALGQCVNFFYTLQGEAAGAQAFANFDTLLAPFVRADALSPDEVKQALQEFVFNLNVPTRVGFQTPFTNLSLDLKPHPLLASQHVVIGGVPQREVYADFQHEMDVLNSALCDVLAGGDAKGRVFTFPIPTYNITRDFAWGSSVTDKLCAVVAKYGTPYFANFIGSDMSPEDMRSMCCNLQLDLKSLSKRGGGLFGAYPQTGSIGVVSINMPRIGFQARDEHDFIDRLDRLLEIARISLETKRKALEHLADKGLYPYTKFYLRRIKQHLGGYWHNHFATIGLVGMHEACLNLLGVGIGTPEGIEFTTRVLDHMRARLREFQEETGNMYNLEATPAESTAYRLALLDKARFPKIACANESAYRTGAKPFYTNSSRLPVDFDGNIFEVLDLQEPLQTRYTGGTVLHVYTGEAAADPAAVKRFLRMVCENYRLPYFTITPTFSVCPAHGYMRGERNPCPECGAPTEVYTRVVGYFRPVAQWNEGKQEEFKLRRQFSIGERA